MVIHHACRGGGGCCSLYLFNSSGCGGGGGGAKSIDLIRAASAGQELVSRKRQRKEKGAGKLW